MKSLKNSKVSVVNSRKLTTDLIYRVYFFFSFFFSSIEQIKIIYKYSISPNNKRRKYWKISNLQNVDHYYQNLRQTKKSSLVSYVLICAIDRFIITETLSKLLQKIRIKFGIDTLNFNQYLFLFIKRIWRIIIRILRRGWYLRGSDID